MAREGLEAQGVQPKNTIFQRILDYLGCNRGDDVVTGAYNMPEARSARPSVAPSSRPSQASRSLPGGRGRGSSSTTTLPRHDSSLPLHRSPSVQLTLGHTSHDLGEGSQPYLSTRGISMPEETRLPEINQYGGQGTFTRGEGSQQVLMVKFLIHLQ
jgi:hypothetical protein